MFSVYKYYENPSMQVKGPHYTKKDDFVEVRELMPQTKFFDAPGQKSNLLDAAPAQPDVEAEAVQQPIAAGAEWQRS